MTPSPYLFFDGNCEEALEFYAGLFGASVETLARYAGSPAAAMVPPDWGDKILYALLKLGDGVIHASDAPPGRYFQPQGFSVSVAVEDLEKGRAAFDALSEGGQVFMPFAPSFFAKGFGMLSDRYHIPWMINCD
ncbi:VOC family protein [Mesorhizobium sp. BR1-1-16]|uniref:VOC family protein n=1 Tax=Mesorhizobium sp. BR1-1-16 TaxID=2876653 RepID=UPI001CCA2BB1|nr:VOC family protein [Mesorhizobium sp. BR1-1-16]MBZ9936294.1 VOC family protein [Mesorhizobium sp. BR1-1-16]